RLSSPKSRATENEVASIEEASTVPPTLKAQPTQSAPSATGGNPAPRGESESVPFSTKGSIKYKRGSTEIQFGRKHKLVLPRLGLGAETDLLNLRRPASLILALTLDESGKVTRADVLKSSGSKNLDQAFKVAAYEWWLEPTQDKSGKPIKDVVPFSIGFP